MEVACAVNLGEHTGPYWHEKNSDLTVCSRHRVQYDERENEFGPYDWEPIPACAGCGTMESKMWWKCCPEHCTEQGIDVMCDSCKNILHPPKLKLYNPEEN